MTYDWLLLRWIYLRASRPYPIHRLIFDASESALRASMVRNLVLTPFIDLAFAHFMFSCEKD
jgi:hypothetical protein